VGKAGWWGWGSESGIGDWELGSETWIVTAGATNYLCGTADWSLRDGLATSRPAQERQRAYIPPRRRKEPSASVRARVGRALTS
jgi:hypothetical protein